MFCLLFIENFLSDSLIQCSIEHQSEETVRVKGRKIHEHLYFELINMIPDANDTHQVPNCQKHQATFHRNGRWYFRSFPENFPADDIHVIVESKDEHRGCSQVKQNK